MTNIQPDLPLAPKPIRSDVTLEHGAMPNSPNSFVHTFRGELGMLLDRCEMQFQRPSTDPFVSPSLAHAVVGLSAVLGYRESAKEWLERYARLAEDATSFTSVATHQLRVARLRSLLGDPTGAIQALVRVREVLSQEDSSFYSWYVARMGVEYYRLGMVSEAQALWQSIDQKIGSLFIGQAAVAVARIDLREGQFADAILMLRTALSASECVANYWDRLVLYREIFALADKAGATELRAAVLRSLELYSSSSEDIDIQIQIDSAVELFRYGCKDSAQRLMLKVTDRVEKAPNRRFNLDGSTVDYEQEFQAAKGCAAVGLTGRYNGHLNKLRYPVWRIEVLERVCEAKIISRRPEREVVALARDIERRKQRLGDLPACNFHLELAFLYCQHGQHDRVVKHLRSISLEDLSLVETSRIVALAVEAGGTEIAAALLNRFFNAPLAGAENSEVNSPYALLRLSDVMIPLAGLE